MRVELIVNPVSGKGRGPRLAAALVEVLTARGHTAGVRETHSGEDTVAKAAAAAAECERLVVLGGDGTLGTVLAGLPDEPPPVAFVPTGTSNLVGHEFHLPSRPRAVADLLEEGRVQQLDTGLVNQRPSFLVWDFGPGGELMRRMESRRDGPIRKSQYLPLIWRMMAEWRAPLQTVTADGEELGEFEYGIVAGLPRYGSGRLRLGPCEYSDGLWELYLIPKLTVLRGARCALAAFRGGLAGVPGVVHRQVRRVRVAGAAPAPIQVDGDFAGTTPVEFALTDRRLPLLVPRR